MVTDGLTSLRIGLLGGFRVSIDDRPVDAAAWRLRKAASLVKLLALSANHCLHREQLVDQLWPDLEPGPAANNLHQALHVARRVIDPSPGGSSPYLRLRNDLLILGPLDRLWVDVEEFEATAAEARRTGDAGAYQRAISLYRGGLLPEDLYEEWAANRREGLHNLNLALILELASLYESANRPGPAIELLRRALTGDPALEEAHTGLMRLYAQAGQRHQALRQYEHLRAALWQELAVEPEEATQRLYQQVLAGHSSGGGALQRVSPAAAETGRPTRHHNLPAALSSFVGRQREIEEIVGLLGATRLLTVTGAGGAGKTRLASQVAGRVLDRFPDGVWLVELAPLSNGALVPQTVARVVEVAEQAGLPLADLLVRALESKQLLLLLDNCEHLLDPCAALAEKLLHACPDVHILITSREPLGIAGEITVSVAPLPLPEFDASPDALPAIDELLGCDSVRLFVERAQYRRPDFVLTADNAPSVIRICRQLAGIPLALELAAARIGPLTVEQIASRLDEAPDLPSGGRRTSRPEHQSLSRALDWSYDLLSERERRLFNFSSVFAGGWPLEAAESIWGAEEGDRGSNDALDLLSRLVDKSLVVAEAGGDREVRYRLLEPVRRYAHKRLVQSGEATAAARKHAGYFLALSEQAEPRIIGAEQALWLDRLEREHDNLRGALAWAVEHDEVDVGLRLAAALWRFWFTRGHVIEGRRTLDQLLALPGARDGSAAPATTAYALNAAGALAYYQGDFGNAMQYYERTLAIRRELGDVRGAAGTLGNMGLVEKERGNYERAIALHEEDLALKREVHDLDGITYALNNLGIAEQDRGNYARAVALHEESLAMKRKLGHTAGIITSLNNLGAVAVEQREYDRAVSLLEDSLDLGRELGVRRSIATALVNLGRVWQERGEFDKAWECYENVIPIIRETGDRAQSTEWLEGVATLLAREGDAARATKLFAAAGAMRAAIGARISAQDRTRHEPTMHRLRDALGARSFDEAWSNGQHLSFEQVSRLAMTHEKPGVSGKEHVLTQREREIAELAAQGLTNRQIAERLVIAERTVDTHLGHILSKLGLSSRRQVADALAER